MGSAARPSVRQRPATGECYCTITAPSRSGPAPCGCRVTSRGHFRFRAGPSPIGLGRHQFRSSHTMRTTPDGRSRTIPTTERTIVHDVMGLMKIAVAPSSATTIAARGRARLGLAGTAFLSLLDHRRTIRAGGRARSVPARSCRSVRPPISTGRLHVAKGLIAMTAAPARPRRVRNTVVVSRLGPRRGMAVGRRCGPAPIGPRCPRRRRDRRRYAPLRAVLVDAVAAC